jgi:LysM repeat protein
MPLSQLKITKEGDPASTLTVLYNPEEYTVNKDNNFSVQPVPGLGAPIVHFVNGNQRTLDVDLFFDSYDSPKLPKDDVRLQTDPVVRLMDIESETHTPPVLLVQMASLDLRCVLSRVSEHFLMFMPNGVPVRARLGCTFIETRDRSLEAKAANLQTADFSKAHVVAPGETLSDVAAELYRDPAQWRAIAIANDIADPLAVETGRSLRVPALPFTDPDSGEALV